MEQGARPRRVERGRTRRQELRTGMVVWSLALGVGMPAVLTGCSKPLLSPREPRSQYSRYDLVRNQYAPQYLEDEYGRRIPNLRGRLLEPQ